VLRTSQSIGLRAQPIVTSLLAAALALTACGGADATTASSEIPASASTTAATATSRAPTTTTPPSGESVELNEGLPRTVDYVWLETTVTAATLAAVEPRTYLSDEPTPGDDTYLFLTLEIANRSDGEGAIFSPLPYRAMIGDDAIPPEVVIEGRGNIGLGPLGTDEKIVAFPVPAGATFGALALALVSDDRIPAVLPLTGDLVDGEYPLSRSVTGEGPAQGGVSGCNQPLDITMQGATIDIELPESDNPPTTYGSRRANIGERFLSVDLQIYNNGGLRCGGGGTNYDTNLFRLIVDGVPRAPVTFLSGIIGPEAAVDLSVHFVIPRDATSVDFTVGSEDATRFLVPVDVSSMPPVPEEDYAG